MLRDELKRKLRQFKKLEVSIRFSSLPQGDRQLVWREFFSDKGSVDPAPRYPLDRLLGMAVDELTAVFDEYFYRVYYEYYRENGMTHNALYDPRLLSLLGLTAGAGPDEVKRRFRELAKKYHPDHGGDRDQFVELMDTYTRLTHWR